MNKKLLIAALALLTTTAAVTAAALNSNHHPVPVNKECSREKAEHCKKDAASCAKMERTNCFF